MANVNIKSLSSTLSCFAIMIAGGCASVNARMPDIKQEAVSQEQTRQADISFARYQRLNARLQRVGRRVLTANADLCQRTREDIGVQTLRLKDMPKALRETAKTKWGLDGKPRIIDAPETHTDLIGDYLVHEGHVIDPMSENFNPAQAHSAQGGEQIQLTANSVCHYPLRLKYTPTINAYADGRHITVTSAMMDFTTDDELALIIGHELGHNTQGHIRKIVQNRIFSLGRASFTRQFESESDYVGLYYMARAGYDINLAPQFWRKLAEISIKSLKTAKSHPIIPERYIRLQATILEIERKREEGVSLLPNMKGRK